LARQSDPEISGSPFVEVDRSHHLKVFCSGKAIMRTRRRNDALEPSTALKRARKGWLEIEEVRPTVEEMRNFQTFMEKLEASGKAEKGLVKVIPPDNWCWDASGCDFFSRKPRELRRLVRPIKQFISGRKGAFRVSLLNSKRKSVLAFREEAWIEDSRRPSLKRTPNPLLPVMRGSWKMQLDIGIITWAGIWSRTLNGLATIGTCKSFSMKLVLGRDPKGNECWKGTGSFETEAAGVIEDSCTIYIFSTFLSDANCQCRHVEGFGENMLGKYRLSGELERTLDGVSYCWATRKYPLKREEISEIEFDFQEMKERFHKMDVHSIESAYWSSLGEHSPPTKYGADQVGSAFGDGEADGWNLNNLDTILRTGFGGHQAKGITTSMMYVGLWRATFSFHTEDMELNSINFLHHGAPKFWYCVPPKYARKFEILAQQEYGEDFVHCCEFLRHKNILVSPTLLEKAGIPYVRAIQYPGEFMITFPRAYHAGFNLGFNVAEAVNFATYRWIEFGRKATWCKCEGWTFRLDVDNFVETLREYHPELLPKTPAVGDRIVLHYPVKRKSDSEAEEEKEEEELEPVVLGVVCRVRRGTQGTKFLLYSVPESTIQVKGRPFDPERDEWDWPIPTPMEVKKFVPVKEFATKLEIELEMQDINGGTFSSSSSSSSAKEDQQPTVSLLSKVHHLHPTRFLISRLKADAFAKEMKKVSLLLQQAAEKAILQTIKNEPT